MGVTRRRGMAYLVVGLFGLYTLEFGIVGILPDVSRRYDLTTQQAGLLVGCFALLVAVTGPFTVLWASRWPIRRVLVASLVAFTLISATSAVAPTFGVLIVLRGLAALVHPVFFATAFTAAGRLYPERDRTRATSTAIIGTTLGLVVGVPVTAWIASALSYEAALLFCGLTTAIAAVGMALRLPGNLDGAPLSFGHQLSVLRRPSLWLRLVSTVLVLAEMFAVYSYAADVLTNRTHNGAAAVSRLLVAFGIGGLLGNLAVGRLLAQLPRTTVVLHPVILALIYLLLFAGAPHGLGSATVLVMVWGAVHTSGLGVSQVWTSAAAPDAPQFVTSMYVSAANAGVVLGSTFGGALVSAAGVRGALDAGLLAGAATLVVLVVTLVAQRARPPQTESTP